MCSKDSSGAYSRSDYINVKTHVVHTDSSVKTHLVHKVDQITYKVAVKTHLVHTDSSEKTHLGHTVDQII